jgi:D-sedoheptulose 7-phosphate isomerase
MSCYSRGYIERLKQVLDLFPHDQFERMITALLAAYAEDRRIFIMGNGGSAMTASHFACDLNKGCSLGRDRRFKVICLNDSMSTILAYANDLSYEHVFFEQLKNFFMPGDVVIGISGSGNSPNVLRALEYANQQKGVTIGWCGFVGGRLGSLAKIPLVISSQDMQQIEDVHMIIAHAAMQRLAQSISDICDDARKC